MPVTDADIRHRANDESGHDRAYVAADVEDALTVIERLIQSPP